MEGTLRKYYLTSVRSKVFGEVSVDRIKFGVDN